jgi:SAM-dependent methyltransferase
MAVLPKNRSTILEIGARHGVITRLLAQRFSAVTALDLEKPSFHIDRVTAIKGDVQRLEFSDNAFDCILCTEVLEHVPDLASAAREVVRVARHEILIGVPNQQDTRVGRTTCGTCGKANPPYGHINVLDEKTLRKLFYGCELVDVRGVDQNTERTNFVSAFLMDIGLNQYGTYDQEEPCIYCGRRLVRPKLKSGVRRACGAAGLRIYTTQRKFNRPRATWIHALFRKL